MATQFRLDGAKAGNQADATGRADDEALDRATAGIMGWVAMDLMTGGAPAVAQELMTEKKVFALPSYTTQSGRTLKDVKIGWESYGTLTPTSPTPC